MLFEITALLRYLGTRKNRSMSALGVSPLAYEICGICRDESSWGISKSKERITKDAPSTILFAHRVKNIERLRRLVQDNHFVGNIAGYAEQVARAQRLLLVADEKRHP